MLFKLFGITWNIFPLSALVWGTWFGCLWLFIPIIFVTDVPLLSRALIFIVICATYMAPREFTEKMMTGTNK